LAAAESGELRGESAIDQEIARTEEPHAALGALLPDEAPDAYISDKDIVPEATRSGTRTETVGCGRSGSALHPRLLRAGALPLGGQLTAPGSRWPAAESPS
jgi:hypothetical protein